MQPNQPIHQRQLAHAAGVDEGFTSRIVHKLEADELVERDASGAIRVTNPKLMLDAWREGYDFSKHMILKGHMAGRSAEESLRRLVEPLQKKKLRVAVTGLAGAWLLTKFAGFRLTTVLVSDEPSRAGLAEAGFQGDERGANTWLVVPNDDGVFLGSEERDGPRLRSPDAGLLGSEGTSRACQRGGRRAAQAPPGLEPMMPPKPNRASGYVPEQLRQVRATCLYVATKLGDLVAVTRRGDRWRPRPVAPGRPGGRGERRRPPRRHHRFGPGAGARHPRRPALPSADGEAQAGAGFSEDVNDEGNPTRQRWKIDGPPKVTLDFSIAPSRGERSPRRPPQHRARLRGDRSAPGLHLAFVDRHRVVLDGTDHLR